MAIKVKDAAASAKKFVQRAAAAAPDYAAGVKGAGQSWEAGAVAGAENYGTGVTQAVNDKRFERGVRAAGGAKYQERASTLGAQRFPTGVQAAESAWQKGAAPFLEVIRGLTLPPRRPKGDPGNYMRAQAVGEALNKARLGR